MASPNPMFSLTLGMLRPRSKDETTGNPGLVETAYELEYL